MFNIKLFLIFTFDFGQSIPNTSVSVQRFSTFVKNGDWFGGKVLLRKDNSNEISYD